MNPERMIVCVPIIMAVTPAEFPDFQIFWSVWHATWTSWKLFLKLDFDKWLWKKANSVGTERHSWNSRRRFVQPGEVIGVEEAGRITAAIQKVMCIMEGKT